MQQYLQGHLIQLKGLFKKKTTTSKWDNYLNFENCVF